MELHKLTAAQMQRLLQQKEVKAEELTEAVFNRIEAVEGQVKAFVYTDKEKALAQAKEVDKKIANGESLPPLAGVPAALKDNICAKGERTTCSSKMLEQFVPPYSATVTEKLDDSHVVRTGKLNMDEFAMGSSTESSYFATTKNPWNFEKVPGGSSGGAAAAVSADQTVFALGSDTGGSIRQPAAYCGVVGLKPTYGRVSRYGVVAFASSLDQVGPITKDVTDSALVLNAISGYDQMDSTSVNVEVPDYTKALVNDVKGLKIGVPKEFLGEGIDPGVRTAIEGAIAKYQELGAEVEEISLPHTEYALPAYYIIATAEASSNLARFDGVKYGFRAAEAENLIEMYSKTRSQGFGAEVKRRIVLGTYALSSGYYDAYYLKAMKVRTLIKQDIEKALEKYDVILTPTSPTTAFNIGEKMDKPASMYLSDVCTNTANLAGIPSISIPCGFSEGLPVGLQLMGRAFGEADLLRVAYTFEQNTDYHTQKPSLEVIG
ncbi:aspartyl-tRNA(Asn)/glutamyl-tRNA(Gln) amidotransferase subunit A [Desulfitispora alkaliphila]|uniref:Asp-tRNA(Asn)/Glu-tRNA(Gln) amidotransferase subunit GatA n=1 Tax=Desulfitispora alkaliphila TaxID=622674 RepID=UPI003D1DB5D3